VPIQSPEGLICFKDKQRVCGPDCMAFTTPPAGPDYVDQQWARCILLVNSHRTGKHLAVIYGLLSEQNQKAKTLQADQLRMGQIPPPMPK
jgi:hypothetical protein